MRVVIQIPEVRRIAMTTRKTYSGRLSAKELRRRSFRG
jgi:hypothetical protein